MAQEITLQAVNLALMPFGYVAKIEALAGALIIWFNHTGAHPESARIIPPLAVPYLGTRTVQQYVDYVETHLTTRGDPL